jgi:dehydrogenase/reductase SDR family protein 12
MLTRVQQSIIINRPVEKVFAYITDYRNAPKWQPTILETRVMPEGPAQEGVRVTDVRTFIGYKIESAYKITELEPNAQVSFESMSGPFPYHGSVFFKPLDNATRLMYELVIEAKGFFKLTGSMLASSMKQEVETSLDLLKRLLEAEG